MKGALWTFDRALLILSVMDGKEDPTGVPLDIQNFWVRVRRIPPIFLTLAVTEKIGGNLRVFVLVDKGSNGDCLGSYLHI